MQKRKFTREFKAQGFNIIYDKIGFLCGNMEKGCKKTACRY